MMKRALPALLLILCLLPCLAQGEEAPSRLYHFTSLNEAPPELAQALSDAIGADGEVLDGYATLRFGAWRYGEAVARDGEGYVLCALDYLNGAWRVTRSHAALRQDEAPALLPEAVIDEYDDDAVGQIDGCDRFMIVYAGASFSWFASAEGWRLQAIVRGDQRFEFGGDTVSLYTGDLSERTGCAFCLMPLALETFDLATVPADWEGFVALSDASPYGDRSQAMISYEAGGLYREQIVNTVALLSLCDQPGGKVIACLFDGVEAEAIAESGEYVQLRFDGLTGWTESACVLRGSERAEDWWLRGGPRGELCGHISIDGYLSYYASPEEPARIVARAPVDSACRLQAVRADGKWFLAHDENGEAGWLPMEAVCETDNFHDAYVYSSDPSRRLNLRSGPGTQYASLGKYYSGVRVILRPSIQSVKGWAPVFIEGVAGWVDTEYLCFWSDYAGREWLPPLSTVQGVNEKGLNLRAAPAKTGEVINAYPAGTRVEIMGVTDAWAHVRLADGNTGYMMLQYLGGEPKQAARNSFAAREALAFYGYFYADGGYTLRETGEALGAGTALRVTERPAARWRAKADAGGAAAVFYGAEEYVYVQAADGGEGGFIRAEEVDFWK